MDTHQELTAQFGGRGVPDVVFFDHCGPTKRVVSVQGQTPLVSVIGSLND